MTNPTDQETIVVGQLFTAYGTYNPAFRARNEETQPSSLSDFVPAGEYIAHWLLNVGEDLPTSFSELQAVAGNVWQLDLTVNVPNGTTKVLHVVLKTDDNPRNCPHRFATLNFMADAGIGLTITPIPGVAASATNSHTIQNYPANGVINLSAAQIVPGDFKSIVVADGVADELQAELRVPADGTWHPAGDHTHHLQTFRNKRASHLVFVRRSGANEHRRMVALHNLIVSNDR